MNDRFLFHGKRVEDGEWIEGTYRQHPIYSKCGKCIDHYNHFIDKLDGYSEYINIDTIGQCTGLRDKNGKLIFEGDIVKLVLQSGEIRCFEVSIKTVIRRITSHPDFDEPTAKVAITGVVFQWRGYELFPCVDENGMPDTLKMEIIGNIYDNPELLQSAT